MTHTNFRIDWVASPTPVSGYNIYRGSALGNESNVPLNDSLITGTSFTDETVFPGLIYSYAVTAVFNGVESNESLDIVSTPVAFPLTPLALDLGAAAGFGLLASSTITNVPDSETIISGDVGIFPGTSITGFGTSTSVSGAMHISDFVAGYAQASLGVAIGVVSAYDGAVTTLSGDIGGQTLAPGFYNSTSSLQITGILILDAGSNPDAVWIFRIGSTLTTATENSNIVLIGGAQAANIFWIVGSSATIGVGTTFAGNILAQASITANTGAHVNGRLLAKTGAITLDGNSVIIFQSGALINLPASPDNTPPAPPAAPTNLVITPEISMLRG
jgi:hypothetical protein